MRNVPISLLFFSFLHTAAGQAPVINPDAIVNAATYTAPLAPGALAVLFGTNLSNETVAATSFPLPKTLGGVRLQINGEDVVLLYVSPTQINFQVPERSLTGKLPLILSGPHGSSAPVGVVVSMVAPGIFTKSGGSCGPGAILNTTPEGLFVENGPAASAEPGGWISIFSTGLGSTDFPPAAGEAATMTVPPSRYSRGGGSVYLGYAPWSSLWMAPVFSGLAPGFVGLGQTVVQLPLNAPEDCEVPLYLDTEGRLSQPVSLSIKRGGGRCVPSEIVRLATLTWSKRVTTGPGQREQSKSESFEARFLRGGSTWLNYPRPIQLSSNTYNNASGGKAGPSCGGYVGANSQAGDLKLTAQFGTTTLPPFRTRNDEYLYRKELPEGSLLPGRLAVESSGSSEIGAFRSEVSLPGMIRVKTDLSPGTIIDKRRDFTVEWEGGDASTIVNVKLVSIADFNESFYLGSEHFVRGDAGSVTFPVVQRSGGWYELPAARYAIGVAMVIVRVLPQAPTVFSADGLRLGGQHLWEYVFEYKNLTIGVPPTAPPADQ